MNEAIQTGPSRTGRHIRKDPSLSKGEAHLSFYRTVTALLSGILFFSLFCCALSTNAYAVIENAPGTGARSAILYEANSETVLYESNANQKLPIASITKIMTAYVVLESCDLDETVQIKKEWTLIEGSSSGIREGQCCTVRQLLYALLLASGNDAAAALASHAAGGVAEFAELMNRKAEELGMTNSSFKNPHGLDEHGHYSTAADMAKLTAAAMRNKDFALIVSTKDAKIGDLEFTNHNKMLWNYPDTVGVKTGYTSSAGRTLVTCCKKNDMILICVTLNDSDDWDDHAGMYDWAAAHYRMKTALCAGETLAELKVISGVSDTVRVCGNEDLSFLLEKDDELRVSLNLPKFIYAGVVKGNKAGTADILINGVKHRTVDLYFAQTVTLDMRVPLTFWEKLKWSWYLANQYTRP
jgi:D-alanyl-D-alanine carboxypeptidase